MADTDTKAFEQLRQELRRRAENVVEHFEQADSNRARFVNDIALALQRAYEDGKKTYARPLVPPSHCFERAFITNLELSPSDAKYHCNAVLTVKEVAEHIRAKEANLRTLLNTESAADMALLTYIKSLRLVDAALGRAPYVYVSFTSDLASGTLWLQRIERNEPTTAPNVPIDDRFNIDIRILQQQLSDVGATLRLERQLNERPDKIRKCIETQKELRQEISQLQALQASSSSLKQRVGRLSIARQVLNDDPAAALQMLKLLDVFTTRCEFSYHIDAFEYVGLSPHFRKLGAGEAAPHYNYVFATTADGVRLLSVTEEE